MEVTPVSHHSQRIRSWAAYTSSLTLPPLARTFLHNVGDACLRHRSYQPHQARLARSWGRDRRQVIRWVKLLEERGLLRKIRRGKKLTNVYRLARTLWNRLVGQTRPKVPSFLQQTLFRLGLRIGIQKETMGAAGIRGSD
jgi:hypothetical protein